MEIKIVCMTFLWVVSLKLLLLVSFLSFEADNVRVYVDADRLGNTYLKDTIAM